MNIGAEEKWTHWFLSVFSSFHGPFDCYEAPNDVFFCVQGTIGEQGIKGEKGEEGQDGKTGRLGFPGKKGDPGEKVDL